MTRQETKYSTLVNSPSARANFVTNALAFCNQYNFGGMSRWNIRLSQLNVHFEFYFSAYDVPGISTYLDHINIMTYDYHGSWDRKTGHVSPLYAHPDDTNLYFNTICYNVEQGWTVEQDPLGTMGPYAYSGNQWVSYDDVAMVQTKAEYVLSKGIGVVL
ncbi:hypothetical protein Avbf_10087 [Armadillidium vulgare]|nr:hypothetical protein Avbf_10087 [Armadillidium vulgare]